jgi:uncharacterized HAD superfamily protein
MKGKLGFDLDGVLYNWTEVVFEEFKNHGIIPQQTDYDTFWEEDWKLYEPGHFFQNLVLDPTTYYRCAMDTRTKEILHELGENYTLFFITHRPVSAEIITRRWLKDAGLFNDNLYITTNKLKIIRELLLDYYVEDRIKIVEELEKFITTFIKTTPWNKNATFKRAIRINNLEELKGYLI